MNNAVDTKWTIAYKLVGVLIYDPRILALSWIVWCTQSSPWFTDLQSVHLRCSVWPPFIGNKKKEKKSKTGLSSYSYLRKLKDSQMEDVGGVILEFNGVDDQ
jgi:hypothetical protein